MALAPKISTLTRLKRNSSKDRFDQTVRTANAEAEPMLRTLKPCGYRRVGIAAGHRAVGLFANPPPRELFAVLNSYSAAASRAEKHTFRGHHGRQRYRPRLGIDEEIGICMLASWDGRELQARPMGAYVRYEENAIYFLADARHHSDDDIARYRKVCLAFADTGGQKYVSLAGDAEIFTDRAKIRELWGTPARAWWGFSRRSEHPAFESHSTRRPVLGCAWYHYRLRENGRRRDDRYPTQHGREPKGSDAMTQHVSQEKPKQPLEDPELGPKGPRSPYPVDEPIDPKGPGSEPDYFPGKPRKRSAQAQAFFTAAHSTWSSPPLSELAASALNFKVARPSRVRVCLAAAICSGGLRG